MMILNVARFGLTKEIGSVQSGRRWWRVDGACGANLEGRRRGCFDLADANAKTSKLRLRLVLKVRCVERVALLLPTPTSTGTISIRALIAWHNMATA